MGLFSNLFDKIKPYQPKGSFYKLIYSSSDLLVKDVSVLKHEKALIEGILLFIGYCKLVTRNEGFLATDILKPLTNEVLDHIKHGGLLNYERDKNVNFVNSRIELYKQELSEVIFSEENNHIAGYAVYNLLENPLTTSPKRSSDLFKHMEILPKLSFCFKEINKFLLQQYDFQVDLSNNEEENNYNQVCPLCGGHYEINELTKVSFVDYDMGQRLTAYTCSYCTNNLKQTDETFRLEQ